MPRALKNDMATLVRVSRQQLKIAEELGAALRAKMQDPGWEPDEEWRKDFKNVNETLAQAGQSLIRGLEGNKKNLTSVPTEQLEAQLKAEIMRMATTFTPDEWAALDKVRMQSALGVSTATKGKKQ